MKVLTLIIEPYRHIVFLAELLHKTQVAPHTRMVALRNFILISGNAEGIIVKRENGRIDYIDVFFKIYGEKIVVPSIIGIVAGNGNGEGKLFGSLSFGKIDQET